MKLPRNKAMAIAAGVAAATLVVGSGVLVLEAASGAGTVLTAGPAATDSATVVTQVAYDDTYAVVGTDQPASSAAPAAAASSAPAAAPATEAPTTEAEHAVEPTTEPEPEPRPEPTTTTTGPPPSTTPTTTPGVLYPKDLPPGWEIPENWPANKPLPPIPPGCKLGHLEDNGVWNCEN